MKKYLKLMSLFLGLMVSTSAFVACGGDDDDDQPTNQQPGDQSNLSEAILGTWYLVEEEPGKVNVVVMSFEKNGRGKWGEYKAKQNNNWTLEKEADMIDMSWTLQGKTLMMNVMGEQRSGEVVVNTDGTMTVTRKMEEGNDKVVVRKVAANQNGQTILAKELKERKGVDLVVNDGNNQQSGAGSIEGTWLAYQDEGEGDINHAIIFEGNKIEVIIVAWSQRMIGTYEYRDGKVFANYTEFYSGRGEHGNGWGEGAINAKTLDCGLWIPCVAEDFGGIEMFSEFEFKIDGNTAHGTASRVQDYKRQPASTVNISDRIVGKWFWNGFEIAPIQGQEMIEGRRAGYEFKANGHCTYFECFYQEGAFTSGVTQTGTYTIDGVNLKMTWNFVAGGNDQEIESKDTLIVDEVEIMYPSAGDDATFFKRYNTNGGWTEEGPFKKK